MKKQYVIPVLLIAMLITFVGVKWAMNYGAQAIPSDTPTESKDPTGTSTPTVPSTPQTPSDVPTQPAPVPTQACIFYIPHPDDEVLNMGAAVLEAQKHYDPVILVLLTKGTASATLHLVNDKLASQGLSALTRDELGESRLMDFRESTAHLGIPSDNIHLNELQDSQVKSADVKEIILSFEAMYPHALHQTMTWDDTHPDHAAAGTALRELQAAGSIDEARYIVFLLHWDQYPAANITAITADADLTKYKAALNSYYVWNPQEGRYSIGILSTKAAFDFASEHFATHWIK